MSNGECKTDQEATPLANVQGYANAILGKADQCARVASIIDDKLFGKKKVGVKDKESKEVTDPPLGRIYAIQEILDKADRILTKHYDSLVKLNETL